MFIGIRNHFTAVEYHPTVSDGEIVWTKLIAGRNRSVFMCSFYTPPTNDINSLNHLCEFLESLYNSESSSPVIILSGDFNLYGMKDVAM